jgi:hypothetical protein
MFTLHLARIRPYTNPDRLPTLDPFTSNLNCNTQLTIDRVCVSILLSTRTQQRLGRTAHLVQSQLKT